MSDPKPFSVREVQRKREAETEPLSSATTVPSRPGTRGTPPREESSPRPQAAKAPPPIDPLRLGAAVLRHWKWIPIAAFALFLPAIILGLLRFRTGYYVSVQLIRREVGTTLRASQLGEAFKPRQVTAATVVNIMLAPRLLERVGAQTTPPITGAQLRTQLTIKPERDTDLISATFSSKLGAAATADLINRYAAEVVALTAQMQADEADELDRFLKGQLEQLDNDLKAVGQELMDFSRTSEFYAADREVEAYLRQLSELEVRLETAKANANAVGFRISSFEHELARQSPVALDLERARSALAALKVTYADENPLIKDAKDKVAALEHQLSEAATGGTNSVERYRYTDNTVANDLYLRLLTLYGERESLSKETAQIAELRSRVQERLRSVPEKGQRYAQIVSRQQSLQAARDMLAGRQREAQVFKENPPGLYRLFSKATEESVETSSRWKKILLVALASLALGAGGALLVICGRELLDLRTVSAADLQRVTRVPHTLTAPDLGTLDAPELARWRFRAWSQLLRQLGLQGSDGVIIAFVSAVPGEGKSTLIRHFQDAAHDRGMLVSTITNAPTGGQVPSMPLAGALSSPGELLQRIRRHNGQPLELVVDSSWTWCLENRERLAAALEAWKQLPGLVLLIELPPLSSLDSVLAAELMPAVTWVAESGRSLQRDLESIVRVAHAADIRLVATVLNREPKLLARIASLLKFGATAAVPLMLSLG